MIRHRFILLSATLLLPILGAAARAQDAPVGFRTPSENIACQFYHYDGPTLRCDIGGMSARPKRPTDCELEWGHSFEINAKGSADRVCAGDTVADPRLPVLAYGKTWQRDGITCRSDQSGLICSNARQRGFLLSRTTQRVF
jgi:hypothetical protein